MQLEGDGGLLMFLEANMLLSRAGECLQIMHGKRGNWVHVAGRILYLDWAFLVLSLVPLAKRLSCHVSGHSSASCIQMEQSRR